MRAIEALWGWWIEQPERRSALISSIGLLAAAGFIFWCAVELTSSTTDLPDPAGDQAVKGLEAVANETLAVVLYIGGAMLVAAAIVLAWFSRKRRFARSWR